MAEHNDQEIIDAVNSFRRDSHEARKDRLRKNRLNRDAFEQRQDFSHKMQGQSTEFIPKTSEAADQLSAFVKKALISFGDWFSMDFPDEELVTSESARKVLRCHLENLPIEGDWTNKTDFFTIMSDAMQTALLEAVMIFKVHGRPIDRPYFKLKEGKTFASVQPWNLIIDLIPPDDFYQDPTGNNLYKIHHIERDIHQVIELADKGVYDKGVVDELVESMTRSESSDDERRKDNKQAEVDTAEPLTLRRPVGIDEFWGTILDREGRVTHRNIFCALANKKFLIRKPKDFPYWTGEDPFVVIPLVRTAFSVNHRALFDQVTPLNFALNELANLIIDGGIASVWGVKQLRISHLEDPTQISNGIPQGKTLIVNDTLPPGEKVLEQVTEGQVPQDALAVYRLLEQELNNASKSNELTLGNLPTKEVRATEIVEASQSQGVMIDQIAGDIERGLETVLRKAWTLIVQFADDLFVPDLRNSMSDRELIKFSRSSEEERFELMVGACTFKVFGLSSTLSRARDFQKIMAILQVASQNPLLLPVMLRKASGDKIWDQLFKMVNINPGLFEKSEEEIARAPEDQRTAQQFLGGQGSQTSPTGEAGLQSDISQEAAPTGGL